MTQRAANGHLITSSAMARSVRGRIPQRLGRPQIGDELELVPMRGDMVSPPVALTIFRLRS
jgi:hypothetical protein